MDSHILNMYHQARYRTIGHKIMRSMSESLSSESSCNQNSPEYSQDQASSRYEEESNEGKYWDAQNGNLWSQNQKINITKNQDSSIDEEDIDVQDVSIDEKTLDSSDHEGDPDTMEENSLIEGADYDVIQVFAVDPDLDLEGSSEDEEQEEEYEDSNDEDEGEYLNEEDRCKDTGTDNLFPYQQNSSESICQDNLGINLDTLVVSNVDEYFIKENKDILAVKDEPVVKDVDEYFIKNIKEPIQPTVEEDFLIPTKLPDEPELRIAKDIPSVEEFLATVAVNDTKVEIIKDIIAPEPEIEPEVPLNESDLEVLPNIEDLKRYLLEDIPYNKLKSAQRSCSVPHSPIHNICLDIDAKTCLSFEDLNLDLSDLSFENVKDKSNNSSKSDDIPRTLTEEDVNSFLITSTSVPSVKEHDDFCSQDMEIDRPIESLINSIEQTSDLKPHVMTQNIPVESIKTSLTQIPAIVPPVILQDESTESKKISRKQTLVSAIVSQNTPVETITSTIQKPVKTLSVLPKSPAKPKPTVLDFCIEKNIKKEKADVKAEGDDFVDVESCNDTVIPVLEANNLNSLLEQFEATEKLNTKTKTTVVKIEPKAKNLTSLTNGMRLQDAGVQLNKTKMRQILMPSTINTTVRRSPSPVHSDHDYCSTKKRHSLPNIKGGRSLLKPEVLSSNHRILSSRHRSCKNKKIVYHQSSDEESEKCNDVKKKVVTTRASDDDSDIKKKSSTKQILKTTPNTNYRKNRISPVHMVSNDNNIDKSNGSVMVANASKASDTSCSQNSNGSIKLTIKNKSEVIIKNCDSKDNHEIKIIEKDQSSSVESSVANNSAEKSIVKPKQIIEKSEETETFKEENSKPEDFYVTLFPDKKDVQIPQNISKHTEKRSHDDVSKVSPEPTNGIEIEQPQKKKKLNLQEYKLRRGATSNNSSAQVSPEAIFPEMPCNINLEKDTKSIIHQKPTIDESNVKASENSETAKKIFDPIREASRKILMNSKKQKAEATRKRDEDIVMSKIPKVDNLELQPLISDAEMMKIVGMSQDSIIPIPIASEIVQQPSKDYDEIILVSVGTNTEDRFFKKPEIIPEIKKHKVQSPPKENKSTINFKIRKSDNVLKQNVFDSMKNDRSPTEEKKSDMKIDEERYKGITATLKSVGKHVDTKISSNSLFASIQDVVMKKATNVAQNAPNVEHKNKPNSPVHKQEIKYAKPIIVRDFDETADHGEDKVILHLEKNRKKPESTAITIQTDAIEEYKTLTVEITKQDTPEEQSISPRKRNDSDMSMSSECSPVRKLATSKSEEHTKHRNEVKRERSLPKDKRSRSKERHEIKYRRSRSHSRGHRRNRSRSRTRSRSRGRFRRYRRSDSPYRRKRRSRSPYGRRSPSIRRDYRSNRSRSRSRYADKAKSPIVKKPSPQKSCDKKFTKSLTPPIRKPTVSESSDTSTSSSSSSGSSSSGSSRNSRRASSAFRRNESRNTTFRKSYSSEDRESNTPVEERRIVFVGRLEQDITKAALRSQFTKFGPVTEVRLHSKEDGTRYGFVTYQRPRDAWSAVEAASTFPQYDVGFGGRRAFCRQSYADLDGLEAKYTESAFHGQAAVPPRRSDDMSFEQMLLDIKKKLNKRKGDKRPEDSA